MKLDIIFRTCTKVYCVHDDMLRPFNSTKRQIVLKCLSSLVNSIKSNIGVKLHLFDDHSPEKDLSDMKGIIEKSGIPYHIEKLQKSGNGNSLEAVFRYGKTLDSNLIYFCEDDYLHKPETIKCIIEAYKDIVEITKNDAVIFPCDYIDRYSIIEPSHIFALKDRHWRTIESTTGTFVVSKNVLEKYFQFYLAFAAYNKIDKGGEWKTIDHIYKEVKCYSPMPSLTAHLNDEKLLSPFVNWKGIWDSIEIPD